MKIMLDCDGVITDFVGGCEKLFGKIEIWPPGEYNIAKVFGMPKNKFWKPINDAFIFGLKYTKEFADIMQVLDGYDITILTAPVWNGIHGRHMWIHKYLPEFFRQHKYLIGPDKAACAYDGSILIDDSDKNCHDFIKAGGQAILFPRPWNSNHDIIDPIDYLKMRIQECRDNLKIFGKRR